MSTLSPSLVISISWPWMAVATPGFELVNSCECFSVAPLGTKEFSTLYDKTFS